MNIRQRHSLRSERPVQIARAQDRVGAAVGRANRHPSGRVERRLIEAYDRLVETEAPS